MIEVNKELNAGETKIYNALKELSNNRNLAFGKKKILTKAGYDTSYIKNVDAFKTLEDKGIINFILNGRRKSYFITDKTEAIHKGNNRKLDKVNGVEPTPLKVFSLGKFNNMDMSVIDSKIGKVVPMKHIYKALDIDRQMFYRYVHKNYELLQEQVIKIRLGIRNTKQICITKDGIMAILMKMDYNLFSEDKRKLILDFQKWIVEKMGKLISIGSVSISKEAKENVQKNIGKAVNLSEKDIDILFDDVTKLITDKLHNLHGKMHEYSKECKLKENSLQYYKDREKQWVSKLVDLREKIYSVR